LAVVTMIAEKLPDWDVNYRPIRLTKPQTGGSLFC
jgi:hypothetical protein